MGKINPVVSFGIGGSAETERVFSKNHLASENKLSPEVKSKIASMNLQRVAGNVYECPSTKDFWKVQGNKVVKLVGSEVNNGESILAADEQTPQISLKGFLDDLEF
jgi:hypothetical protein